MANIAFNKNLHETSDSLKKTQQGMAYFADTGPLGTTCGECAHRVKGRCQQYRILAGRGGATVPEATPSCKYFSSETLQIMRKDKPRSQPLFDNLPVMTRQELEKAK